MDDSTSLPGAATWNVYAYGSGYRSCASAYLMPAVTGMLAKARPNATIFELGCGSGADAAWLMARGHPTIGVDPSASGIAIANERYPDIVLRQGSSDEDLAGRFGKFDVVLSLEVVEHVYSPKGFAETVASLLKPDGIAIVSTPYHGYLKNLAMAVTGKFDDHFTALWEGGHIKFWSKRTLDRLFAAAGMEPCAYERVGRMPALAKSMVVAYRLAAPVAK